MKLTIKTLIVLILIISVIGYGYYLKKTNSIAGPSEDKVYFVINSGDTVDAIAQNLFDSGLIISPLAFKIYVWRQGLDNKLQAGNYDLWPSLKLKDIADLIANGQAVSRERTIRLIEGWTIDDIDAYLAKEGITTAGDITAIAGNQVSDWPDALDRPAFIDELPPTATLEGYLFPDTYRIFSDSSAYDIIAKQLANFEDRIPDEWQEEMKRQGRSLPETITMASIIEKEVKGAKDMKIVAGILYERLRLGMRLEVDSTINYITGKNDAQAALTDLEINSPYNTYRNYGLPPGPISNPGLNAIEAAIYPEESEYLFYLNRQDTGETIFSKTYAEHIRNKQIYLK